MFLMEAKNGVDVLSIERAVHVGVVLKDAAIFLVLLDDLFALLR